MTAAGFRHAFFTRTGGVSSGPYTSLNFSASVGDATDCVNSNIHIAARWLDVEVPRLYFAQQVHGCEFIEVRDHGAEQVQSQNADAIITARAGSACAIRTADCVPILIADAGSGQVAAIHAGWKGVVAGIIPRTLRRLLDAGSLASQLLAAVGPHIRLAAFEVSEEVAQLIAQSAPGACVVTRQAGQRPHVSLLDAVIYQLESAGLARSRIEDVGGCTFEDEQRFFSFRRQGAASGRHLHAIVARGASRAD